MNVTPESQVQHITVQDNAPVVVTKPQEVTLTPTKSQSLNVTPQYNRVVIGNGQHNLTALLSQLKNDIELLYKDEVTQSEASLLQRISVQSDAFGALVEQYTQLRTEFTNDSVVSSSELNRIERSLSDSEQALSESIVLLNSKFDTGSVSNEALIEDIKRTQATATDALAEEIKNFRATTVTDKAITDASIQDTQRTITDEKSALTEQINQARAAIETEQSLRVASLDEVNRTVADQDKVLTESVKQLRSEVKTDTDKLTADLEEESRTRVDKLGAMSESIRQQKSTFENENSLLDGRIIEASRTMVSETEALSEKIEKVETDFLSDKQITGAAIERIDKSVSDANGAVARAKEELKAKYETLDGDLKTHGATLTKESEARADQFGSISTTIEKLTADNGTDGSIANIVNKKFVEVSEQVGSLSSLYQSITATGDDADEASIASIVENAIAQVSEEFGTTAETVTTLMGEDLVDGSLAKIVNDLNIKINNDVGVVAKAIETLEADGDTEGSMAKIVSDALVQVKKDIGAAAKTIETLTAETGDGSIASIVVTATTATSTAANEYADGLHETAINAADSALTDSKLYADGVKTDAIAHADGTLKTAKEYAEAQASDAVKHANTQYKNATDYADGIYADALEADTQATAALETKLTTKIDTNAVQIKLQQTNLLDLSAWEESELTTSPVGNTGMEWSLNGRADENSIILGEDPFGESGLVWKAYSQDGSASGGWNTDITIDPNQSHRSTVWIKKVSNLTDGSTYFGCHGSHTLNLSGSPQTNPYFWSGDLPELNKWYLLVGVIHGANYEGGYSGVSGMYDPVTGEKVITFTEFKNKPLPEPAEDDLDPPTTITQRHRAYLYYPTGVGTVQYFARPRFEAINTDTQGLTTLLGGKAFLDKLNETYSEINEQRTIVDGVAAAYTLELDVNGRVSGINTYNDGRKSDFIITADTFEMRDPDAPDNAIFGVDADGKFFAKNIEIRDDSDNVLLSSGNKIPVSKLSGLGAFATASSISSDNVTGLGSLATKNGVTTSEVSGLGTLATKSGVTTSDITGLGKLATKDNLTSKEVTDLGDLATLSTLSYSKLDSTLKGQLDGKVEFHFAESDPSTNWDTDAKSKATGDMWYDTDDKQLYRWSGTAWKSIEDKKAIAAATAASTAQSTANTAKTNASTAQTTANTAKTDASNADKKAVTAQTTADSKRRVFVAQPTTPYDEGDLWDRGSVTGIYRCKTARASGNYTSTDWTVVADRTADNTAKGFAGQGALATKSSIDTSYVSGLGKLATKDKVTSDEVTGLGSFATQSKLLASNITTYIEGAAIGSALIGKAAIKTASIETGAITTALIEDAAISSAKIGDAAITNAKIGNVIESTAKAADGEPNWSIKKDGGIEARNITIRDTNGNVMLTSGGKLASTLISGLGSLATKSKVTTSEVTGLGTLATKSSVSTSEVTGLGGLATKDKVATSEVTGLGTLATKNSVATTEVTGLGSLATKNGVTTAEVTGLGKLATKDKVADTEVTGLGTLATANSVSYSSVTGTKPPTNADKTSENVAASVTGQTAFATLSKINAANISTYIAGAAIGEAYIDNLAVSSAKIKDAAVSTAKIDDLAVQTVKIGNQAVTFPASTFTAAHETVGHAAGEVTLQTVTVASEEAPTEVLGTVELTRVGGRIVGNYIPVRINLRRDGTIIRTIQQVRVSVLQYQPHEVIIVGFTIPPSSGNVVYTLTAEITGGEGTVQASDRYLRALETKK